MAGQSQAANLGGMLSQIANTLGTGVDAEPYVRGVQNTFRPTVTDPNNLEQLTALQAWQSRLGRDEAARTTAAQMEGLKAEQTEAANIRAAKTQGQLRSNMAQIARNPNIPEETKQTTLARLQAHLDTLSTTEEQAARNSGFLQKTLRAAEQERLAQAQEQRAQETAARARDEAAWQQGERERLETRRDALSEYAMATTPEERRAISAANPQFRAEFNKAEATRLQMESLQQAAADTQVEMSEAPDLSKLNTEDLSPALQAQLKLVEGKAKGFNPKTGQWATQAARGAFNQAVADFNKAQIGEIQAETQRMQQLNSKLEAERLKLGMEVDVVSPQEVNAQLGPVLAANDYDEEDLETMSAEEYAAVYEQAEKRAKVLKNETTFAQLANVRMAEDPSKFSAEEISKASGGRVEGRVAEAEYEAFRRKYIARLQGREPGGQEETLAQYKVWSKQKDKTPEPEESSAPSVPAARPDFSAVRSGENSGINILSELFSGRGDRMDQFKQNLRERQTADQQDTSLADMNNANIRVERIDKAPENMGIY